MAPGTRAHDRVREPVAAWRGRCPASARFRVTFRCAGWVVSVFKFDWSTQAGRGVSLTGASWPERFGRYVVGRYRGPEVRVVGPVSA